MWFLSSLPIMEIIQAYKCDCKAVQLSGPLLYWKRWRGRSYEWLRKMSLVIFQDNHWRGNKTQERADNLSRIQSKERKNSVLVTRATSNMIIHFIWLTLSSLRQIFQDETYISSSFSKFKQYNFSFPMFRFLLSIRWDMRRKYFCLSYPR